MSPSPEATPAPDKTRADLEWHRVIAAVAERCAGELGKKAALGLEFADSFESAKRKQEELREAMSLASSGSPLPVPATTEVGEAIERLRVGGVLSGLELRTLARMLLGA